MQGLPSNPGLAGGVTGQVEDGFGLTWSGELPSPG